MHSGSVPNIPHLSLRAPRSLLPGRTGRCWSTVTELHFSFLGQLLSCSVCSALEQSTGISLPSQRWHLGNVAMLQGGSSQRNRRGSQAQVPQELFREWWVNRDSVWHCQLGDLPLRASEEHGMAWHPCTSERLQMGKPQDTTALGSAGTEGTVGHSCCMPGSTTPLPPGQEKGTGNTGENANEDIDKNCRLAGLLQFSLKVN